MKKEIIRQKSGGQQVAWTVNLYWKRLKVHRVRMNEILIKFWFASSGGNDVGSFCSMMVNSHMRWMKAWVFSSTGLGIWSNQPCFYSNSLRRFRKRAYSCPMSSKLLMLNKSPATPILFSSKLLTAQLLWRARVRKSLSGGITFLCNWSNQKFATTNEIPSLKVKITNVSCYLPRSFLIWFLIH